MRTTMDRKPGDDLVMATVMGPNHSASTEASLGVIAFRIAFYNKVLGGKYTLAPLAY